MSDSFSSSVLPDGRRVDDLKVTDLRRELELRGLSRSGVKKELCARLSSALDSDSPFCEITTDVDGKPKTAEHLLEHVDDALEIDAVNSDEDVADTSTGTVIHVSNTNGSDNLDSCHRTVSPVNSVVENSMSQKVVDSSENLPNASESNTVDNERDLPNTEVHESPSSTQLPTRRRQWGMRNTQNSVPLSSESIQKLIPSPITPPVIGPINETPSLSTSDVAMVMTAEDKSTDEQLKTKPKDEEHSIIEREEELEVHALIESMDGDDSQINDESLQREPASDRSSHSKQSEKSTRESLRNERPTDDTTTEIQDRPASRLQSQPDGVSETSKDTLIVKSSPAKRKGPKETKAVGYLVELPERIEPSQPAKHTPTDILYIRFLVRPFTAEQLRQMVSRFGTVVDLWLDRIKSTSLIRMKSVEEATNCRDSLDGSRWPSMNPRVLRCDFASDELFEWMKANAESGELQPPVHLVLGIKPPEDRERSDSKSRKQASEQESSTKVGDGVSNDLRHRLERTGRDSNASRTARSKTSETKTNPALDSAGKPEEPAKLLNDLFRKTTATPSIYWLPLTKEQARKQNEERRRSYTLKRSLQASHSERKATRSPFANAPSSEPLSPPRKSSHLAAASTTTTVAAAPMGDSRKTDKPVHGSTKTSDTSKPADPKKVPTTQTENRPSLTETKSKPKTTKLESSNHSEKLEKSSKNEVKNERSSDVNRKRERSPFTPDRKNQHSTSSTSDQPTSAKQSRSSTNPPNLDNTSKQKISKTPDKQAKSAPTDKPTSQTQPNVTGARSDSSKIKSTSDRDLNDPRRKSISGSRPDRHRSKSSDKRTRSPSHGRSHRSRR